MVAYNFDDRFIDKIRDGTKSQTIRRPRRRHARTGETLQLYCGLRTTQALKLIPDPICVGVDAVKIDLRSLGDTIQPPSENIEAQRLFQDCTIEVNGYYLDRRHGYARRDGFENFRTFEKSDEFMWPFNAMVMFWMVRHGPVLFEGFAIRWKDEPL